MTREYWVCDPGVLGLWPGSTGFVTREYWVCDPGVLGL